MAKSFQDYIEESACGKPEIRTQMLLARRVYENIPIGAESILPAKGEAVTLRSLAISGGSESGTGLTSWRVYDVALARSKMGWRASILFYQPRLYTGQAAELNGSRMEWEDGPYTYGQMIFVSSDGATGVPTKGVTYFTPIGGTQESGETGRICVSLRRDTEAMPGLYHHTALFRRRITY